ncbi:MAG: flagellar motor protein MotB [Helicobacteraceae bacterium]|jgi:chemotaxis protein MotB|nr:flagellar motor protein MotB [Helicobacteraceae bacterium]
MARKKSGGDDCPICPPRWIVQFGDMMSLLLVFFILLLSMSTIDSKKVNEAIGSLVGAMSVLEGGTQSEISRERMQLATPIVPQTETDEIVNRVAVMVSEFNEIIRRQGGDEAIQIQEAIDGFMIQLPASLLFRTGRAEIVNADALLLLKRIAILTDAMPKDLEIIARGHTDNFEIDGDSPFRDAWSLSSARAVAVVKELINDGVKPERLGAAGYASYQPIATNATEQGRARNRRVEIHFLGQSQSNKPEAPKSVLDLPRQ